MKAFSSVITLASLSILLIYSGCGSKSSETLQQKNLKQFSKTWKVNTVSDGGVDSTQHWTNFTITFSGTYSSSSDTYNYTCTGRPPLSVWPSSGTWQFDSVNPQNTVVRDPSGDNLQVGYVLGANGTTLQLTFTYNGTGYTRTQNVQGNWVFNLIPQ